MRKLNYNDYKQYRSELVPVDVLAHFKETLLKDGGASDLFDIDDTNYINDINKWIKDNGYTFQLRDMIEQWVETNNVNELLRAIGENAIYLEADSASRTSMNRITGEVSQNNWIGFNLHLKGLVKHYDRVEVENENTPQVKATYSRWKYSRISGMDSELQQFADQWEADTDENKGICPVFKHIHRWYIEYENKMIVQYENNVLVHKYDSDLDAILIPMVLTNPQKYNKALSSMTKLGIEIPEEGIQEKLLEALTDTYTYDYDLPEFDKKSIKLDVRMEVNADGLLEVTPIFTIDGREPTEDDYVPETFSFEIEPVLDNIPANLKYKVKAMGLYSEKMRANETMVISNGLVDRGGDIEHLLWTGECIVQLFGWVKDRKDADKHLIYMDVDAAMPTGHGRLVDFTQFFGENLGPLYLAPHSSSVVITPNVDVGAFVWHPYIGNGGTRIVHTKLNKEPMFPNMDPNKDYTGVFEFEHWTDNVLRTTLGNPTISQLQLTHKGVQWYKQVVRHVETGEVWINEEWSWFNDNDLPDITEKPDGPFVPDGMTYPTWQQVGG